MSERPASHFEQSAVLPFRWADDVLEVLLITSHKRRRWVLPKGIVEPGLSPRASAAKEGLEEAGIQGRVFRVPLGSYRYEKWGGVCTVEVFPQAVDHLLAVWPESHRERSWLGIGEAAARLDEPDLQTLVHSLPGYLENEID